MKYTPKLIVYTLLQSLFCAVAPLVYIFTQYGETSGGLQYKLPLGLILLVFVVIVIAKNTLLKPHIQKLTAQIAQHEGDLKVESDPEKAKNITAELKRERTIETFLTAIGPILLLAALLVACKAMENAILRLSGAIGFTLVSFIIGTVFGVLAAREVQWKHVKEKDNER